MFWKGPLFTKDGFIDTCIDLETCEFISKEKEEDGILVPLFATVILISEILRQENHCLTILV